MPKGPGPGPHQGPHQGPHPDRESWKSQHAFKLGIWNLDWIQLQLYGIMSPWRTLLNPTRKLPPLKIKVKFSCKTSLSGCFVLTLYWMDFNQLFSDCLVNLENKNDNKIKIMGLLISHQMRGGGFFPHFLSQLLRNRFKPNFQWLWC